MGNQTPVNAGKPWTEEEMRLVASFAPTWRNIQMLAKCLGRSVHAIQYFYCKLYMRTSALKKQILVYDTKSEQFAKILKIRREFGIAIGI